MDQTECTIAIAVCGVGTDTRAARPLQRSPIRESADTSERNRSVRIAISCFKFRMAPPFDIFGWPHANTRARKWGLHHGVDNHSPVLRLWCNRLSGGFANPDSFSRDTCRWLVYAGTLAPLAIVKVIGFVSQPAESRNEYIVEWTSGKASRTELRPLGVSQRKKPRPTACRSAAPPCRSRTTSTGAQVRQRPDCARD